MADKINTTERNNETSFVFSRINYIITLVGIACIAIGYLLMSGGGSKDPNVFNEEIYNFRRIRLAPMVIITGFGILIYGIFKKNKSVK